jgi:hypothetical protein
MADCAVAYRAGLARAGAWIVALGMAAALAGCGVPDDNSAAGQQFKAQFDKGTHDSCVKAAVSKGAAADKAEAYCTCVVAQADQLKNADKATLGMHPDKMTAMAQACASNLQN